MAPVMIDRLRRAAGLPPRLLLAKAARVVRRELGAAVSRRRDVLLPTYERLPPEGPGLERRLPPIDPALPPERARRLVEAASRYCAHRFDLLGSGWVEVEHGAVAAGLEGHRYGPDARVEPDADGRWLEARLNRANLADARRRWQLVDPGYRPIDWQLDVKSGYRWSERTWSPEVRYGHIPGADVKVPWELARMHHLPQLAVAFACAAAARAGAAAGYAREFRNQVLDFAATNPPRYGVNWVCTMDVAIRVANWLVAFDLFRAAGVCFDAPFETVFEASVRDHARHVATHLEWSPTLRSNHYLADVAGLLFAAAYLPAGPDADAWLALAVRELAAEATAQFGEDGAGFEASTSYHRLSGEMVVFATALVLGLPDARRAALGRYDHRRHAGPPALPPAPLPLEAIPGLARPVPLPAALFERLERIAECTMDLTGPEGRVVQVGDNDSGRFLKLDPALDAGLAEVALDHRHLVAAVDGLVPRDDLAGFAGAGGADRAVVRGLAAGVRLPARRPRRDDAAPLAAYPGLGLYVLRAPGLWLAVRCGTNGQRGRGGHAHNDQLSIELAVGGRQIVVDPGTYLYTPAPAARNRFRSTAMHSTLGVEGREQNGWPDGLPGLFSMRDDARATVEEVREGRFVGVHHGFGVQHRRTLEVTAGGVAGRDECAAPGPRRIAFHLAAGVTVDEAGERGATLVIAGDVAVRFVADSGRWSVEPGEYSPGYGLVAPAAVLCLLGVGETTCWRIERRT
jgi:hypothetical protein